MALELGQKVYVREKLISYPDSIGLNSDMRKFAGKLVTIQATKNTLSYGKIYQIVEDNGHFYWDERWFCKNPEKETIKVKYPINWEDIISKGYGKI